MSDTRVGNRSAAKTKTTHQIGEVAEQVGLSLRTIRYYEEMGLIEPSERSNGGFRLYSDSDIEQLLLIKQMKPLGFTVDEMRELLELRRDLEGSLPATKRRAALERLSELANDAGAKTESLRAQFTMAEEFAGRLRREVSRLRRSR